MNYSHTASQNSRIDSILHHRSPPTESSHSTSTKTRVLNYGATHSLHPGEGLILVLGLSHQGVAEGELAHYLEQA